MPSRNALLLLVVLGGCSQLPSRASMFEEYAGRPVDDFRIVHLDGWEVVSRNKLVLHNGVSESYLITTWASCDLRHVDVVGVTDTNGHVSKFEKVIAGNQRCPITDLRPVDMKAMSADREAMRKVEREKAAD